ncbi:MAG: DNA-directed RNA polymerase subunit alpha [Deferribacteraceae bacterium]|jgi:DNA-directed RNA polymerase subunit alpha|nr:DNA-directed RNA polymerase subunit alpha [Deferribacteraceae bacterium]
MAITMNFKNLKRPRNLEPVGEVTNRYGKFVAEPYQKGFGITVGNALKRVLLSSIEGSAVVGVKIAGVKGESVSGIKEGLTDILLNLKEVELSLSAEEGQTAYIKKTGQGPVTAADIEGGELLAVLNPDHHLFTIKGSAEINIELYIERGFGYVTSEELKGKFSDPKIILLDASFTPVKKANYTVDNARVGQSTDFDRLTLEVITDGSVRPDDAIAYSSQIIRDFISLFINFDEEDEVEVQEAPKINEKQTELLTRSIEELELSVRSSNCLKNARIKTIGELCEKTEGELLKTKNFGKKSLEEIKKVLNTLGLKLGYGLVETNDSQGEI